MTLKCKCICMHSIRKGRASYSWSINSCRRNVDLMSGRTSLLSFSARRKGIRVSSSLSWSSSNQLSMGIPLSTCNKDKGKSQAVMTATLVRELMYYSKQYVRIARQQMIGRATSKWAEKRRKRRPRFTKAVPT